MRTTTLTTLAITFAIATGCTSAPPQGEIVTIPYVGSSTVAVFLREAEPAYGRARFELDTAPESSGGEQAILDGHTSFAGIARSPRPETLRAGIVSTLIGRDAIAVIASDGLPVTDLSLEQLRGIFDGSILNWREVGGPDLDVRPFIVGEGSATRAVFRDAVLGGADYGACEVVQPDDRMVATVAAARGGIGHISFSFLGEATGVHAVAVEGQRPTVTNFEYPIARPLHLLWKESQPEIEAFVQWALSDDGQRVVMREFVGLRVIAHDTVAEEAPRTGTLVVHTETFAVDDGGVYYYPHRPYEVRTRHGELVRRVRNHRTENDESAAKIELPPGIYLIRPETASGQRVEMLAKVDVGQTTRVSVEEYLRRRQR